MSDYRIEMMEDENGNLTKALISVKRFDTMYLSRDSKGPEMFALTLNEGIEHAINSSLQAEVDRLKGALEEILVLYREDGDASDCAETAMDNMNRMAADINECPMCNSGDIETTYREDYDKNICGDCGYEWAEIKD